MSADKPACARAQVLECLCGDRFRVARTGPVPKACPECRRIHKLELDRERRVKARARKLAALPHTVSCIDCGRPIEGYRRGRRGGVPKRCRACAEGHRKARNIESAERSYRRRKARDGSAFRLSPGQAGPGLEGMR